MLSSVETPPIMTTPITSPEAFSTALPEEPPESRESAEAECARRSAAGGGESARAEEAEGAEAAEHFTLDVDISDDAPCE
jgi:hypothetical protein